MQEDVPKRFSDYLDEVKTSGTRQEKAVLQNSLHYADSERSLCPWGAVLWVYFKGQGHELIFFEGRKHNLENSCADALRIILGNKGSIQNYSASIPAIGPPDL